MYMRDMQGTVTDGDKSYPVECRTGYVNSFNVGARIEVKPLNFRMLTAPVINPRTLEVKEIGTYEVTRHSDRKAPIQVFTRRTDNSWKLLNSRTVTLTFDECKVVQQFK